MLVNPRNRFTRQASSSWPLYSAQAAASLDRQVIAAGTPGFELMQRAARSAWQLIQQQWPDVRQISVLCGGGNNGGDGLLVALHAFQAGMKVRLWLAADPLNYQKEAALAWQAVEQSGLSPQTGAPDAHDLQEDELLVDALLGIGLKGEVRGEIKTWIQAINASKTPVLALDTPSGLLVDNGQLAGSSVQAAVTLTFIVLKPGLFTAEGPEYAGEVWLADLGLQGEDFQEQPLAWLQSCQDASRALLPRKAGGHKGDHGRLLILGGQAGMGGAVILAARAALRTGVGMVKLLTAAENVTAALVSQPEIMAAAWPEDKAALDEQLKEAFAWADALLVGPGLGTDQQAQQICQAVGSFEGPVLVDADALNLWAQGWQPPVAEQRPWVITPHPGEAARLLGWSVHEVQQQRLKAVNLLALKTGSVALLKGAGSCCAEQGGQALPWVCPFGNPGMGVAGMGDLLSGCIASLLAQGLEPLVAARLGMRLHAQAGDQVAADQPRGLLPSDLLPFLREGVN
ncbi:NAD(P)H-hydrate epimerase [Marinospirillum celere]|uniref:Bifunctional NAD(P)H-hydrate repair enzyme n=1 Tax=Marinospirillum celere TaxID=1122252 RepID=A0A1I1ITK1_9GAMM|nr:NAD(P)H-hydrate dehydratase [Marinospirillum celere]SFC39241.1 NAD(P)H-hydrate epimerase [Marinospirillum celere]